MADQFRALIESFAKGKSLSVDGEASAIEFECDDQTVLVIEHPKLTDHLLIEVELSAAAGDGNALAPEALLLLHQLNESARFEHDWVVTISAEGTLQIHCSRLISSVDPSSLELLMAEGLDRGDALQALVASVRETGAATAQNPGAQTDPVSSVQMGSSFLRA